MTVEKILIQESVNLLSDGFNNGDKKIVSTIYCPGVDYFYEDFEIERFGMVYSRLYEETNRCLNALAQCAPLKYRNVDLSNCFRHNLFLFTLSAEIMFQAFHSLIIKNPGATFYIEHHEPNWLVPYLCQLLPIPNLSIDFSLVFEKCGERKSFFRFVPKVHFLKNLVWPSQICTRLSASSKTAIFADYSRSADVLSRIPKNSRVYFTNAKEPKIFIYSLLRNFSFCQMCISKKLKRYHEKTTEDYRAIPDFFWKSESFFVGFPHLRLVIKKAIEYQLDREIPLILHQIDQVNLFFDKCPFIRTVLLDEDMTSLKNAFCQVAQIRRKQCFVECHGAMTAKHGYLPLTADYFFAWGNRQKKKLVRWGCASERIIISGCSKYSQYVKKDDDVIRKRVSKQFHFDPSKKIVLLAPHPLEYSNRFFTAKLIRTQIQPLLDYLLTQKVQLIIKLHPCEMDKGFYLQRLKQSMECKAVLIEKFDPLLLIKASNFLIVHDSTMAVDGFALNRNVIFIPFLPESENLDQSIADFGPYTVFYQPNDMAEFVTTFEQLMADSSRRPAQAQWEAARRDCLNEGGQSSVDIIGSHLLREATNGRTESFR